MESCHIKGKIFPICEIGVICGPSFLCRHLESNTYAAPTIAAEAVGFRLKLLAGHRLHLARLFDYIVVMKHGKIVQRGTFAELSTTAGEFSDLWANYHADGQQTEEGTMIG